MRTTALRAIASAAAAVLSLTLQAQPAGRTNFNEGWTFTKDGNSRVVNLPHDWGVDGPFVQEYPGETGKLAWWGKAEYSKILNVAAPKIEDGTRFLLDIDGAMSFCKVYCNNQFAGEWPYGYASWQADLTPFLKAGQNVIRITLDNPEESSRWYPGGGIYRNVWLTEAPPAGVAHWGTYVTTEVRNVRQDPGATKLSSLPTARKIADATVRLDITLRGNAAGGTVRTTVYEGASHRMRMYIPKGAVSDTTKLDTFRDGQVIRQEIELRDCKLWSPATPILYTAETVVTDADGRSELYFTTFGVRTAEFRADAFYLNGEKTFLKRVCLHHDAGALGAVWDDTAWERRLNILKQMGCNAIRTAHNPPGPEFLDLCDQMGFLVMDELTDTWTIPKKKNGYALIFDEWADKDLRAMIRRDRNHPSVILWSIGNEVGEQGRPEKYSIAYHLTEICHAEDPTRPTTIGSHDPRAAETDFKNSVDVFGFNYKPHLYGKFHAANPDKPYLGSETASTISSRGVYFFPPSDKKEESEANFQVCSYDLYTVPWGQTPEQEWALEDENPTCAGEFVWTGFDYLGEPTPYNADLTVLTNFHDSEARANAERELAEKGKITTPSRSSYFGIIDLAGFPKDRYWLYKARWSDARVLHMLPHWNWEGREGQITPIHVYTNCDSVELFLNGRSYGMKVRGERQYRLRWDDIRYEAGTVKLTGYRNGQAQDEIVRTTGPATKVVMTREGPFGPDRNFGGDGYPPVKLQPVPVGRLVFFDVKVADKNGSLVPTADNLLKFSLSGPGEIVAVDAGDPTCHTPFRSDEIKAFGGLATVIVRRTGAGKIVLTAESDGLKKARWRF